FQHNHAALRDQLSGYTVSDEATRKTIAEIDKQFHYTLDPHGAVAYHALADYLGEYDQGQGVFLETAHPVKFPDTVKLATGKEVPIPQEASYLLSKEKHSIPLKASFAALKEWLLAN
nr:threonine synthase [Escherichia coli]